MCSRDVNTTVAIATIPSLRDSLPYHRKCLLPQILAVGNDIVRAIEIQLVNLVLRHELVDVDDPLALDGDSVKLLGIELDVLALAGPRSL